MAKSNRDIPKKKKRGPPSQGGRKSAQLVRMDGSLTDAIDHWRENNQSDDLSRPEAIRRLVEIGLSKSSAKSRAAPPASPAAKAKELAATAIDRLADASAPADEKASRKRRLLKGPEEFREVRVDHPNAKAKGPNR